MVEKEKYYSLLEGYEQMLKAQYVLKSEMITLIKTRVSKLITGTIPISLVVLERHDVSVKAGNLIQYIEIDKLILHEDGVIQIHGEEEDTGELIVIGINELAISELAALLQILFEDSKYSRLSDHLE